MKMEIDRETIKQTEFLGNVVLTVDTDKRVILGIGIFDPESGIEAAVLDYKDLTHMKNYYQAKLDKSEIWQKICVNNTYDYRDIFEGSFNIKKGE